MPEVTTTTITTPDTTDLSIDVKRITALVKRVVITTPAQYEKAADVLTEIKTRITTVKDFFSETKALASRLHKSICAQEKTLLDPLTDAETAVKRVMSDYKLAELEAQEATQRLIDKAAEKAQQAADKASETGRKRDVDRAASLAETAAAVADEAYVPPAKADKASESIVWRYTIVDASLLPREFLVPDTLAIAKVVKTLGDKAAGMFNGALSITKDIQIRSYK